MITIGGVPLLLPTAEIRAWIAAHIRQDDAYPFLHRSWPGKNLTGLTWPTGFDPARPVEVGTFRWPVGASRWAAGHFLASSNHVAKIRTAAFGRDGKSNTPLPFVMDSPGSTAAEQVKATLYVLPPVPLARLDPVGAQSFNGLWLITVTDSRFWWWQQPVPAMNIACGTTWDDVYSDIAAALGITLTVDPIPAEYLYPSARLNLRYEVIAPVFDAVCFCTGMRLVANYDGTFRAMNLANGASIQAKESANTRRRRVAGSDRFLDTL